MPLHSNLRPILQHGSVRRSVKVGLDLFLALAAWVIATRVFEPGGALTLRSSLTWLLLSGVVALGLNLSRQHYRLLGFRDALRLGVAAVFLALLGILTARILQPRFLPHFRISTAVGAALLTSCLWVFIRSAFRAMDEERQQTRSAGENGVGRRILIVGAGRAGVLTAQEILRHPKIGGEIIGFMDDALEKQGLRIQGIPVLGPTRMLPQIIQEQRPDEVILAVPSASGEFVRNLTNLLAPHPVKVKTVPGIFDLLGGREWKPVIQDVSIEDLLRREPIHLDQDGLREAIEGQTVLITGGGGSIGSEIARQVAQFSPSRIVLLGRGENSLWEAEQDLRHRFPGLNLSLALCDIRNPSRLRQVFESHRPALVFHAAAHKHVPYLESHPGEAVENNVFGTRNVLDASLEHGVSAFVNISTDKAVNPVNVLGATKRLAECLVLEASGRAPAGSRFISVRFGNVLGSRGSVIPVFRRQIAAGGPITITHPEMTRYFMTIPEASQLVLQAGLLGASGKVYVLDMGEPVKILDMAKDMIHLSGLTEGQDLEIAITGMRPGEKLFEELFRDSEQQPSQVHTKVFEGAPEPLDALTLSGGLESLVKTGSLPDPLRMKEYLRLLKQLVPSYTPARNGLARVESSRPDTQPGIRLVERDGKVV